MAQTATHISAGKSLSVTALIAGLASLAVAILFYAIPDAGGTVSAVAFILGLFALIIGIIALKRRQPKGMAITGLVIGSLVVLVMAALFIFALLFIGALLL